MVSVLTVNDLEGKIGLVTTLNGEIAGGLNYSSHSGGLIIGGPDGEIRSFVMPGDRLQIGSKVYVVPKNGVSKSDYLASIRAKR
ncbi:MAG: hypothetical protein AABW73_01670 [Nanoarchaeota archaeon]